MGMIARRESGWTNLNEASFSCRRGSSVGLERAVYQRILNPRSAVITGGKLCDVTRVEAHADRARVQCRRLC